MDREKVIERLEYCAETRDGYVRDCINDAIAMLNEQEKALYELGQLLKERAEEIERLKTQTAGDNHIPLRW